MTVKPPIARILAVEDNTSVARFVQDGFAGIGVEVTVAPTGEAGLEMARRDTFDLFLLDVSLPGINGLEVCRRLKADEKLKTIPVIFYSGEMDPDLDQHGRELGAVECLNKGLPWEQLAARIMAHLP